ncbi:MAG: VCBS repeat-containing protein [Cyclobacteriaceae bacterium]
MIRSLLLFSCVILIWGCSHKSDSDYLFVQIDSLKSGIGFSNDLANAEEFTIVDYLYYYNGGGVGIGDFNNDGLQDIYFTSSEQDNALYINKGNLQFEDITTTSGTASPGSWKTGVAIVDINNDGFEDIYVSRVSRYKHLSGHNELYINNGDLTFTESSAMYGLDFGGFSTQAAFFDMDNDGDQDMYLLNHAIHTQHSYGRASMRQRKDSLSGDRLYENVGNSFIDITASSGIYTSEIGYGLGIGLSDINQDGYVDVYVSNDFSENDYLYINQGNKTFKESFADMAAHTSRFSMGNDLIDINNDGLTDIITLDMLPEDEVVRKNSVGDDSYDIFNMKVSFGYMKQYVRNTVQLNRGNGKFSDIAMLTGMHGTDWSWAPLAADFDLDGDKDVFISNGIQKRPNDLDYIDFIYSDQVKGNKDVTDAEFIEQMPDGSVNNYLFENNGNLDFEMKSELIEQYPGVTNGSAYADLDNDGDLDLILNNLNETASILRNTTNENDSSKKWLKLESDCGARGWVEVYQNQSVQKYEWYRYRGFQSTISAELVIGLDPTRQLDSLVWRLPDGLSKTFRNVPTNQSVTLNCSDASRMDIDYIPVALKFIEAEIDIPFEHRENKFIEFNREALIPHMNSREGPALAIGDVNGDGLEDVFIGGAKYQTSALFIQSDGKFEITENIDFEIHNQYEDVDATFADLDLDNDLDLIVVSGGNEFTDSSHQRNPRVYLNDGNGAFNHQQGWLSEVFTTGSTVAVHDFDNDSWPDIFIGGLAEPWAYGIAPPSYLMHNEGGKGFRDVTADFEGLSHVGMVKDASWIDFDGNGEKDLVLGGLWMGITVFQVEDGAFSDWLTSDEKGWWQCIEPVDYDGDGDMDILAGNLGLNSKLKANLEEPVRLYVNDFDQNGFNECILTHMSDGKESIFQDKGMINKQLPVLKKSFLSNRDYATAELEEIFGSQGIANSLKLEANEFRTGVFINENGQLKFQPFAHQMQFSPTRDFLTTDVNLDGALDVLLGGNFFPASVQEGTYSAGFGNLLLGKINGFELVDNANVNLFLDQDIRQIDEITINNVRHIIALRNDEVPLLLEVVIH